MIFRVAAALVFLLLAGCATTGSAPNDSNDALVDRPVDLDVVQRTGRIKNRSEEASREYTDQQPEFVLE